MSIEAHRCNVPDCKGFVAFENADFDFKNIETDKEFGCYAFSDPTCNECGKRYLVVPHYIVIDVKDKETGDFEEIESACMTQFDKRQEERRHEAEPDPFLRIRNFISKRNYTYAVSDILAEYSSYQESPKYICHSMKDCFNNLESEIKDLLSEVSHDPT